MALTELQLAAFRGLAQSVLKGEEAAAVEAQAAALRQEQQDLWDNNFDNAITVVSGTNTELLVEVDVDPANNITREVQFEALFNGGGASRTIEEKVEEDVPPAS